MRSLVLQTKEFRWVDLNDPTEAEFLELSNEFGISMDHMSDCLDHGHLPKYEMRDLWHFAILRVYDEKASEEGDTIQEITRKVAIFYNHHALITIHRKDQDYLNRLFSKWKTKASNTHPGAKILADIFRAVLVSYVEPINEAEQKIEEFEMKIFLGHDIPKILEALYYLKRKASIFRRMVRIHGDLLKASMTELKFAPARSSELRDLVDRIFFQADTLQENTMHLFNAHVSIASQKTNEVMRVLTIFSVFFMPLTFIVGVYGMNFPNMPEIHHPYGYVYVWMLMIVTVVVLAIWFRRQGWVTSFRKIINDKKQ